MSIRHFIETRRPLPEELHAGMRQAQRELGDPQQLARIRAALDRTLQSSGGGSVPPFTGGTASSGWSRAQLLMLVGASLGALLALLWATGVERASAGLALQPGLAQVHDGAEPQSSYLLLGRASEPAAALQVEPEQAAQARTRRPRATATDAKVAEGAGALDPRGELSILRAAQAELRNQPSASLAHVHEHQARYPQGVFAQEREVIRIDALLALRRDGEARDRAREFLDEYGNSTHAPRVRSLLGVP